MKLNRKSKWASAIGLLVAVVGIGAAVAYATAPTSVVMTYDSADSTTLWHNKATGVPTYVITSNGVDGRIQSAIDTTTGVVGTTQSNPATVSPASMTMPPLSDGEHVVWFRASDDQLVYSVWSTGTVLFKIDTQAPNAPATPTVAATAVRTLRVTGFTGTTDIDKGGVGVQSGVSTYAIEWSTSSTFGVDASGVTSSSVVATSGQASAVLSSLGTTEAVTYYVRVAAIDLAGNPSAWSNKASVKVDGSAPVITIAPGTESAWTTPSVTATLTISDLVSGVASYQYKITPVDSPGAATYTTGTVYPGTISAGATQTVLVPISMGDFKISVAATDTAGNASAASAVYKRDSAKPVTTLSVKPTTPDGLNGTWLTYPEIKLAATDAAVGTTLTTVYQWDATSTANWVGYDGTSVPASSSVDGTHTLYFRTSDSAANTETIPAGVQFVVQTHQPTITFFKGSVVATSATWYNASTTTTASIVATTMVDSVEGSAVANVYFKWDDAAFTKASGATTVVTTPEGIHTLYAYAVDTKGLQGATYSQVFKVDRTKPVVGEFTTPIVYSANPTLTVAVTESASGSHLATGTAKFIADGDHFADGVVGGVVGAETLSFKFTYPLTPGVNIVTVDARDVAGNAATTVFRTITYNPAATVSTVNASAGSHGMISPAGASTYSLNTSATFSIIHDEGYHVADVLVDGVSVGARESYTFNVGETTTHNIVATFAADAPVPGHFGVSTIVNGHGTITGNVSPLAGSDSEYVIAADPGNHVVSVTLDGALVGTSFTIRNIIANHVIIATFAADATPAPSLMPVYRFFNFRQGVHFYTASEAEKANVIATLSSTYRYEGVAYSVNTTNPANSTPLYRFFNYKLGGVHFYTISETEKANVIATMSSTYRYEGVAYNVCATPVTGATPVYRFRALISGVHFYTASETEKANVLATLSTVYTLEGIGFYLAP